MPDREKVINDLNVSKLMLCNPKMLTSEMCVRIGQAINDAIDLLKADGFLTSTDGGVKTGGETEMNHHTRFAEMIFNNGNILFLNTEYITSYGYLKDRDETAVSVLSEAKEIYFPGNQTAEIRNALNCIKSEEKANA